MGKIAHDLLPVEWINMAEDDEDEGSLSRGRANPDAIYREKIESSADALRGCHNPAFFPSEQNPTHNALRTTGKTKSGKRQYPVIVRDTGMKQSY